MDQPVQEARPGRVSRAIPPAAQLPLADGCGDRGGAGEVPQGTPPLGPTQAAGPDAAPRPRKATSSGVDRSPDPFKRGVDQAQAALSTGAPRLSQDLPGGAQRHLPHMWRRHKWAADYKGQFRLKNGNYCFPLRVSDLASRYLLGCDGHSAISLQKSFAHFKGLFETHGLPSRIRTDNGVPFASNALARLSQLSVWFIKLGIYPELIEPGKPQQNGVHERMHRTLPVLADCPRKQEATIPPAASLWAQQRKFDRFREEFNQERPHEALGMKRPGELYRPSRRMMPKRIERYDYPGTTWCGVSAARERSGCCAGRYLSATRCRRIMWA